MKCPECNSPTTSDQIFCRSCGADLATVPAVNHLSGKMVRFGVAAMFGGLMIALTGKMLLHLDVVTYVGIMTTFVGMFAFVYSSMRPSRGAKRRTAYAAPIVLKKAETTRKLVPMNNIDFVPSVTERTTSLLETPVSKQDKPQY